MSAPAFLNEIIPRYPDDSKIEDEAHEEHLSVIADAMALGDSPRYTAMLSKLKNDYLGFGNQRKNWQKNTTKHPLKLFLPSSELQVFL